MRRTLLRFAASVAMVSGALLLADAAVTLAWQEPVSALMNVREQDRLGDELDRLTDRLGRGDPVGRIVMPALGRRDVIVSGTDSATLRTGPGHYRSTAPCRVRARPSRWPVIAPRTGPRSGSS